MARTVAIIDSSTGKLIDADGKVREGDRYRKFAKRILSADKNPVLDYGANGGNSLEISNGGSDGDVVLIRARSLVLTGGNLSVGGKTIEEMLSEEKSEKILKDVVGKDGEISVGFIQDPERPDDMSAKVLQISLDQSIEGKIESITQAIEEIGPDSVVSKSDIARVVDGIDIDNETTPEEAVGLLGLLVERLKDL